MLIVAVPDDDRGHCGAATSPRREQCWGGPGKEPGAVLTEEENKLLCEVGPGTLMGELMRRYWQPFGAEGELDETPVKAVRLLGEDLTLYKDKSGTYGLLDRHCPHRRADLSYGWVEECGLRCG